MNLEEAIQTAIGYEKRVCAVYREAVDLADDGTGQDVFHRLLAEEEGHVAYLESRLAEWQRQGRVNDEELGSSLPSPEALRGAQQQLRRKFEGKNLGSVLEVLRRALAAEAETGTFYRRLLQELEPDDRKLFARFAEIEKAHYELVQLEIDSLTGDAFWYGVAEFDLQAGM